MAELLEAAPKLISAAPLAPPSPHPAGQAEGGEQAVWGAGEGAQGGVRGMILSAALRPGLAVK